MTQCLLVDEDGGERRELSRLFGRFGFSLAESRSAAEALQHCRLHRPDIVVISDQVGGMTSSEFVRRVRRTGHGTAPIVLVCTDKADTDSIGRMIMDGAAECLMKPFDQELLAFKLKQVGLI